MWHLWHVIWKFPEIGDTPKSSILKKFSLINHAFWDIAICGKPHMCVACVAQRSRYSACFDLAEHLGLGIVWFRWSLSHVLFSWEKWTAVRCRSCLIFARVPSNTPRCIKLAYYYHKSYQLPLSFSKTLCVGFLQ